MRIDPQRNHVPEHKRLRAAKGCLVEPVCLLETAGDMEYMVRSSLLVLVAHGTSRISHMSQPMLTHYWLLAGNCTLCRLDMALVAEAEHAELLSCRQQLGPKMTNWTAWLMAKAKAITGKVPTEKRGVKELLSVRP